MEHKNKRKAVSNPEEESSSKRPKHAKIEGEELSMTPWYDTTLVKEGRLKQFDEDTAVWTDVTLKLYSNADLEIEVEPRYGKISSMPLDIGKSIRIRLKPSESAAPLPRADYVGVFCIKNTPQYIVIKRGIHLVFATEDPNEGEKWMHTINYTRLKRTLELKKHSHPLTPCHDPIENSQSVGPSTINLLNLNEDLTCVYCARRLDNDQARHCEFCDYNICGTCASFIVSQPAQKLEYSVNHTQHPLIRFHSVDDPEWFLQTQYAKEYICDVCSSRKAGPVYHCVECGNYDECPDCFKQVATDAPTEQLTNENNNDEMQLDIGFLSHVIVKSGNVFELKQSGRKTLQAASMITTKCWDVSQIDASPVTSAYFEVTFNHLEGQYVSVGIGNQIFVQNQLLGYEQNSFGYCCNGQVTQNVGTNMQVFPSYGNGDTIGVGMLLDSFNLRRLYFTKNGKFLGCFSERVHVGMDCFPGVSFTPNTCQQLNFSTNFTGPFMFDLITVPDHRSTRQNWFEQMPAEIIVRCLSHAAEAAQQVAEFFQVSKTFSSLASNNEIWKKLFLQRWPLQSSKLKLKSWMTLYKRRQDMENHVRHQMRKHLPSAKYRHGAHYIENCDFEFQCPLIIEDIFGKEDEDGNTHCDKCNKTVYKVSDTETLGQYAAMGRCVSLFIKPKLVPIPRIRMGGVPSSRHFHDPARSAVPKPFANLPERSKYK